MTRTIESVRADFPALHQLVHGRPLAYLDNAASAQKPNRVIDTIADFYRRDYANVHRGIHTLSERATARFEAVREQVRAFLGAEHEAEIVFTRGTTESINLVAYGFANGILQPGDEIIVSEMEHHSNIVPWQLACERSGATLRVIPVTDDGRLDLEVFRSLLNERTRLVSVAHVSNALGTINPVREIVELADAAGVPTLLDGAQAVPHQAVDVTQIGCTFYAFSGHKLFGPTGIGVLYGRRDWLDRLPPWQGGGDMIREVRFSGTTYNEPPHKFEAGTPHIAGVIGLGAAIEYVEALGYDWIQAREQELLRYGTEALEAIPGVRLVGTAPEKAAVLSFVIDGLHPHDISTVLDQEGVAVRAGHHCTQPLMERFGVPATTRASMAFYNTVEELDQLAEALRKAIRLLSV